MKNTNTQHTPGPWKHTPGQETIWAKDGELMVARTEYTRGEMEVNEDEANARLIASAPELLTALEDAHNHIEEATNYLAARNLGEPARLLFGKMANCFARTKTAIAKAKGETP